jgi:hypothetical protein
LRLLRNFQKSNVIEYRSREILGDPLLKPKLILRIGVSGRAAARLEIFKNLMSFSISVSLRLRAERHAAKRIPKTPEGASRKSGDARRRLKASKMSPARWLDAHRPQPFGAACVLVGGAPRARGPSVGGHDSTNGSLEASFILNIITGQDNFGKVGF